MKRLVALLLFLSGSSSAFGETLFTWRDGRGTEHFTNSINEIPARYLKKARVLDVATGKKGGLAINQPAQPPAAGSANASAPSPVPLATPAAPLAVPPPAGTPVAPPPAAPVVQQTLPSTPAVAAPPARQPGQSRRGRRHSAIGASQEE
ncbi:hypothetical protein L4X63_02310 [Geomonas sp. Red32]|uniref:hypothetical protein n=1 Tax=Geomonas sp. Red32 TaxID=2912856 RepID=UPI00202CD5F8|nr:hypothetical protein [Geomonas sp. Red32]MCM0080413.1 hypothetical protein [Geomonas sp. Red32]